MLTRKRIIEAVRDCLVKAGTTFRADQVKAYREAIRLDPGFIKAHRNLAFSLDEIGDAEGAGTAYNDLARLLKQKGELDDAIKAFREAIRLAPTHAEVWMDFGDVLIRKNKLEQAARCFEKARKADKNSPELRKRAEERLRKCRKRIESQTR